MEHLINIIIFIVEDNNGKDRFYKSRRGGNARDAKSTMDNGDRYENNKSKG